MTYSQARFKQKAEHICLLPLVWLGYCIAFFYRKPLSGSYFLILPNRDTGGSYKVNADIAQLLRYKKPLLIFTKKERNGGFRHLYEIPGIEKIDLSATIDDKRFHFLNIIWRGIIAHWINRCPNPVVLGGECIYFYKLLPHVKANAQKVEVCHVNKWLNYTQAFIPFIDARVFSTQKIKRDAIAQYHRNKVPAIYLDKLYFIDNKIEMPAVFEANNQHIKVLFVGRGSPQKRVHLVAEIARQLHQIIPPIKFTLVGDVDAFVAEEIKPLLTIHNNISKAEQLRPLYQQHDVLILTSLFEGLPIVVMEMMAQGRVVLSTAVDGIPDYIQHLENGLLIQELHDEVAIVEEGVKLLIQIDADAALLKRLSANARAFALAHFSSNVFDNAYLKLLQGK